MKRVFRLGSKRTVSTEASTTGSQVVQTSTASKKWYQKRQWLIVVAILVLAAIIVGGIIFYQARSNQPKTDPTIAVKPAENAAIDRLTDEPVPTTPEAKVEYYANLAYSYLSIKNYQKALDNALLADSFITNRKVGEGRSVNLTIAKAYQGLGKKAQAREYYQREIDRIKDIEGAEETVQGIEKMKAEVD